MGQGGSLWSESAGRMLSYVTKGWYDRSYIGKWLYEVMGREIDRAEGFVRDLPYQLFAETATWGLMYHELKWGLPVRPALTDGERRQLIYRARDERPPMNPYRMEMILKNLTGREAHVDDMSGPPNTFTVEFEPGGIPIDLASVIERLGEIKQSHVAFSVSAVSMPAGPARVAAGVGQYGWHKPPAIMDRVYMVDDAARGQVHAGLGIHSIYHRNTVTEKEGQYAAAIQ